MLLHHKTLWPDSPPPSTVRVFISEILCESEDDDLFYKKNVLVERNVIVVEI